MRTVRNLLLVGAAERNVGKTELCCRLIRKYKDIVPVVGLKITVVKKNDGKCPRGGDGCGVCSSLKTEYLITEEYSKDSHKDTSKMLASGADKVLWLRVLENHLDQGVDALMASIISFYSNEEFCIICESNSARLAIDPGLFLVLRKEGSDFIKPSCNRVISKADRIIIFNGKSHDINSEEQIVFHNGRWFCKENANAILMAGGNNTRMGTAQKAFLKKGNTTFAADLIAQLRERFIQIIISANDPTPFKSFGCSVVGDILPGQGPLMGIYSALKASSKDANLVVACDIPELNTDLITTICRMSEKYDIILPSFEDGKYEPLMALYRKSCVPVMKRTLEQGKRKISSIFEMLNTKYLKVENADWYHNINTPEDYCRYLSSKNTR